jgi:hypothetical protein
VPLQDAAPQGVLDGAAAQAPAPLQVPSKPQGGAAVHRACGSGVAAGTGWQAPAVPATLHEAQVAQLADEQQTPSTQLPLSHSAPAPQIWPRRFFPQAPPVQTFPGAQSPSTAQTAVQPVPLQAKGVQLWVVAGLQTPAPSQLRANVAVVIPFGQAGPAHCVPAAYSWQPPLPSQKPVVPQVAAPWAMHCPVESAPPAAIGEQVPALAASAQDMHLPAQAVAQQTPWAQMPLPHSVPPAQTAPVGLSPHEPAIQVAGWAQSASALQADLHAAAPQAKGKQELDVGRRQAPAPSQLADGVKVVPVAGQLAAAQAVPFTYFWQAPAWHLPLVPHPVGPWSTHDAAGSGRPAGMAVQVPNVPASAQDWQALAQAVRQQTPCAQLAD